MGLGLVLVVVAVVREEGQVEGVMEEGLRRWR